MENIEMHKGEERKRLKIKGKNILGGGEKSLRMV